MPYLDNPFEVSTGSSRRPTPTTFEHLRKYAELIQQYLRITNQSELVNINQLLDLTGNLYVSNQIARVIAQLIGATPTGFETIKATPAGALHVYPASGAVEGFTDVKIADGDSATIGTIADAIADAGGEGTLSAKLRRISEDLASPKTPLFAYINISGDTTHDIIGVEAGKSHYITSICFTVAGEVDVILRDETGVFSGVMDFGAEGEPRGMTQNHELTPLKCHVGEKFQITLDAAILVSGYVTYYDA